MYDRLLLCYTVISLIRVMLTIASCKNLVKQKIIILSNQHSFQHPPSPTRCASSRNWIGLFKTKEASNTFLDEQKLLFTFNDTLIVKHIFQHQYCQRVKSFFPTSKVNRLHWSMFVKWFIAELTFFQPSWNSRSPACDDSVSVGFSTERSHTVMNHKGECPACISATFEPGWQHSLKFTLMILSSCLC